jgi:hypothetical protein
MGPHTPKSPKSCALTCWSNFFLALSICLFIHLKIIIGPTRRNEPLGMGPHTPKSPKSCALTCWSNVFLALSICLFIHLKNNYRTNSKKRASGERKLIGFFGVGLFLCDCGGRRRMVPL